MKRWSAHTLQLILCVLASGCYSTTIQSGLPAAGGPRVENDERWHSGVISGIAELSGPYDLKEMCPNGWAEIETHTSFVNGFVQFVSSGLYNPQTVSVTCATTAPVPPPAPSASATPERAASPAQLPAPTAEPPAVPPSTSEDALPSTAPAQSPQNTSP